MSSRPEGARKVLTKALLQHRRPPLSNYLGPRGLGRYRGYGEMLAALDRLAERGARLTEAGRSVRGEPLFAVHLGTPKVDARTRTTVLLSGLHPLEWIGIETHLALLERLASADLGQRSIVAFPIANPDGINQVEWNLRTGRYRYVRHNAHGVDLNRNFDARWDHLGLAGRLFPFLFSRGRRPASEPEIAAIAFTLASRRVDRALSLHSFGGAVLYPSAATLRPIADWVEHRRWAQRIAQAADDRRPYRTAACAVWAKGFTHGGLELDWFHERHGALSLLVECSRGGIGLRPSRLLQPFAWYNPPDVETTTLRLASALMPYVAGATL